MSALDLFDLSSANSCVSCGLCLPHCPTFQLTGSEVYSPRGRLGAMTALLAGTVSADGAFDDALSTCLGCRACEAVCPGLVPYGELYEAAQAELVARRPTTGRRVRRVLLGRVLGSRRTIRSFTAAAALVHGSRIERILPRFARRALAGFRPLHPRRSSWVGRSVEPIGTTRGTVALLSGCVMDAWFGPVHDATVGVLTHAGYRVVVPERQTCCGALAAHDGQVREAQKLAKTNVVAFADADVIVSNSAGCSAHLKEYSRWAPGGEDVQTRTRDITEFVAGLIAEGVLPSMTEHRGDVAVQDPCHLRHAQRILAEPRAILRAAGYRPLDIDADGLCCGAAGIYSVLHSETSNELGRRKAREIEASGTQLVASANPGCEMQLRAQLPAGTRVAHPIEIYWEALSASGVRSR